MKRIIQSGVSEKITVGPGDQLEIVIVLLNSSESVDLQIDINGEGARVDISGLYICKQQERVAINVDVRHNVPHCESHQLFKGIVGGEARSNFYGKIVVAPDAQATVALQENHNLLLSDAAIATTKPQLEIYADDVKCSHGATIGSLNEEEQFYMRSRGIPQDEARQLQLISFLAPIISLLPSELQSEVIASI